MIQNEPISFSDRQQEVIDGFNLKRELRGVRQLNNAQLDRMYSIPKHHHIEHLYCVICEGELVGAELDGSSGKCFSCKEKERKERNRVEQKRRRNYQERYRATRKKAEFALGKKLLV